MEAEEVKPAAQDQDFFDAIESLTGKLREDFAYKYMMSVYGMDVVSMYRDKKEEWKRYYCKAIKKWRQDNNLTIKEAAKLMHINQRFLQMIENGLTQPKQMSVSAAVERATGIASRCPCCMNKFKDWGKMFCGDRRAAIPPNPNWGKK